LDAGVIWGVEAEVGEALETKPIVEKGADDPCPVGAVDLDEGSFEKKVDEIKTIEWIELELDKGTVHVEQLEELFAMRLEGDRDDECGRERAEGVVMEKGAQGDRYIGGGVDDGRTKKVQLLAGRKVDDARGVDNGKVESAIVAGVEKDGVQRQVKAGEEACEGGAGVGGRRRKALHVDREPGRGMREGTITIGLWQRDVGFFKTTDGGFSRGREGWGVERDATEKRPAERGHGVVEPEMGAWAFARMGKNRDAFSEMRVHSSHMLKESGANVGVVQPGVDNEVDAGAMGGGTHIEAAGPRDMRKNLVETADMGRGIAEGDERQEQEGCEGQDKIKEDWSRKVGFMGRDEEGAG
jgi:hypothetical protein